MDNSAITVNNQATSRKIVQSNHTVSSAGQEDTYQQNILLNSRAMSQLMMDTNFKREEETKPQNMQRRMEKSTGSATILT